MEFGIDNLDQIVSFQFSNLTMDEMNTIGDHVRFSL